MIDFLFLFVLFFVFDAFFVWLSAALIGITPNSFDSALKAVLSIFLITGFLALIYIPFPLIVIVYLMLKIIALQWSYETSFWNAFKLWISTIILGTIIAIVLLI